MAAAAAAVNFIIPSLIISFVPKRAGWLHTCTQRRLTHSSHLASPVCVSRSHTHCICAGSVSFYATGNSKKNHFLAACFHGGFPSTASQLFPFGKSFSRLRSYQTQKFRYEMKSNVAKWTIGGIGRVSFAHFPGKIAQLLNRCTMG